MKIAVKIFALVLLGVLLVQTLDGYLAVKRELILFDRDMRRDARVLGGALRAALSETWSRAGEGRARELLAQASHGEDRLRIRWVWMAPSAPRRDRPALPLQRLGAVRKGQTVSLLHGHGRHRSLYTYLPLRRPSGRLGALELSESLAHRNAYARETIIRKLWLLGGIALVCGLLLAPLGLLLLGRPLALLADKARRVGGGDLSGPVDIKGKDELGELADSMNRMCAHLKEARTHLEREVEARIQALEQLRHADRLKSVGRLAAGMAHELGTPLNVVSARAELISGGKLPPDDQVASAEVIKEQVARMTNIISQTLDFARKRSTQRVRVDLRDIATRGVALLSSEAAKRDVHLRVEQTDGLTVPTLGDPEQLTQVLMTLVVNALQAMPDGGEVEIHVCREKVPPPTGVDLSSTEVACLRVVDQGEGITSEDLTHIFEPFFTTKEIGEGTGLGLSVAHGIIAEHNGWIAVSSEPGRGSVFSIHLPLEEGR